MGWFPVELDLANHEDLFRVKAGLIRDDEVRRAKVRGVVDSGAARLVIPASVALALGVETSGITKVRYADSHTAQRSIAKDVHLAFGGRDSVFTAIIEPDRDSALLGAIVLEELDMLRFTRSWRLGRK